ncbi:MAG: ABC transporter substrate-binding protein [bacterium]|nr:ABC transporter substrate-binding protein [bacterium]
MKKRMAWLLAGLLLLSALTGCGNEKEDRAPGDAPQTREDTLPGDGGQQEDGTRALVRVGSLKGPTSMGLVWLMDRQEQGLAQNEYTFTMEATADMLLPKVISGELDLVLVPANVASVLYHKTEGGVSVIDINTLGVLYLVSADQSVSEMEDLKGRTIYLTGMGTTPDFVLQYLLAENGIALSDVTLEYKAEAAEVAAYLAENPEAVGLLPQPYVTALSIQNPDIVPVLDTTAEWEKVQGESGGMLVTGVTVVRNEFLAAHPDAVAAFLEEHSESADYANENASGAAALVEHFGIVEKAAVAEKALPYCNITCMTGEEMRSALSGYLTVLSGFDVSFIGGGVPEDAFYYLP